jgi:hypothetical protein
MGAAHRLDEVGQQCRRAPLIKPRPSIQRAIADQVHEKRTAITAAPGAGNANRCIISPKFDLLRDNPTRIWLSPRRSGFNADDADEKDRHRGDRGHTPRFKSFLSRMMGWRDSRHL